MLKDRTNSISLVTKNSGGWTKDISFKEYRMPNTIFISLYPYVSNFIKIKMQMNKVEL